MKLTVFEVHECQSPGCGRTLPDSGLCPRCADEVEGMNRAYFATDPRWPETHKPLPEPVYWVGVGFVITTVAYLVIEFLTGS